MTTPRPRFGKGMPAPTPAPSYRRTRTAEYNTRCPACDEWIDAGIDQIVFTDDGWVHQDCE